MTHPRGLGLDRRVRRSFFPLFPRYSTFGSDIGCRPFCRNVLFICSVVCLFAGLTVETVFIVGLLGVILYSTPATVF